MKKLNLLSRAEMKKVSGGVLPVASCTANCDCPAGTTSPSGSVYKISAVCTFGCTATDNGGASCNDGSADNQCSTYVAQCRPITVAA